MVIKKISYFLFSFLLTLPIMAQSTTVSGTLVDPSSNTWVNAIVTAQFMPSPGIPGPYTWSGGAFSQQPTPVIATTGAFSISLPSNTAIVPSGSSWQFTICPNATLPCAIVNTPVTGATLNIVPIMNAAGAWPTGNVPGTFVNKAYNTSQVGTVPLNVGAIIYNTTSGLLEFWNGTIWQDIGTGGGGGGGPWDALVLPAGGAGTIAAYFGSTPNLVGVIINQTSDINYYPMPYGTSMFDFRSNGQAGAKFQNCNVPAGIYPFGDASFSVRANSPCYWIIDSIGSSTGSDPTGAGAQTESIANYSEGFGWDNGNCNGCTGSDAGWSGATIASFTEFSAVSGIKNGLILGMDVPAAGDVNPWLIAVQYYGGCTAASDQCLTVDQQQINENGQQITTTSIAATSGTGDTHPTLHTLNGSQHVVTGNPGGAPVLDITAASWAGTMVSSGGVYQTQGAITMSHLNTGGSGQVVNPTYTITSVAANTPSTGEATYTGTFATGSSAWINGAVDVTGFTVNPANNGEFHIISMTTTQIVVSNTAAVNESTSATNNAFMEYPVICTGGGGTGMIGWLVQVVPLFNSIHGIVVNPPRSGQPGANYTSTPTCTISSLANQGGAVLATFIPSFTTSTQLINVSGGLTPNTGECILSTPLTGIVTRNTNQTFPFSCTVQKSMPLTTGSVWVVDQLPEKCNVLTAGTPAGIIQSGTISCALPHPLASQMFQGGTSDWFCLDAQNPPLCVNAFGALSATELMYGWVAVGGMGAVPQLGSMLASFSAPNNAAHVYHGTIAAYTAPGSAGQTPTFAYNDVPWQVNDTIIIPLPGASGLVNRFTNTIMDMPPNGVISGHVQLDLVQGPYYAGTVSMYELVNENPYGWYVGCDSSSDRTQCLPVTGTPGYLFAPSVNLIQGVYGDYADMSAPVNGGTLLRVFDNSNTEPYYLFSDVVLGGLKVNPQLFRFEMPNIFVNNNVTLTTLNGQDAVFTDEVEANRGFVTGSSYIQTAAFTGALNFGFIGSYPQPSDAPLSAGGFTGGSLYVGAKPVTFAAAPTVEGTTGSNTYGYQAYGQTPNGYSVPNSVVTTGSGNTATMGTGSAITSFSTNNGFVTLATTATCTPGQLLAIYGLSVGTNLNKQVAQAISCSGTSFSGFFLNSFVPPTVATTADSGTLTPNFILVKVTQAQGDQTVAVARTTGGTVGVICSFSATYQYCPDYNQGIIAATPSGVDTSGVAYFGGPVTIAGLANGCAQFTSGVIGSTGSACGSGGGTGFPITIGATSIAGSSTTTTITGLTLDGVSPTTFGFLDATSSIQTQLNNKAPLAPANIVVALSTTGISGNSCSASAITQTMTGLTSTMGFTTSWTADVTGVAGWGSTGGLVLVAWPTTNTFNYKICNQTASTITPGSASINVGAQ